MLQSTNPDVEDSKGQDAEGVPITYSVAMVHHNKTLVCQGARVPKQLPSAKSRLFFSSIGQ